MSETPQLDVVQMLVRTQFNGAAASLRVVMTIADREEARRMHAELTRICSELAVKHAFGSARRKEEKRR